MSRRERLSADILFSSERVIKVLDGEVNDVFRHIFLHLLPETTGYTASMKKDRLEDEILRLQFMTNTIFVGEHV